MRDMKAFEKYNASEAASKLRADHDTRFGGSTRLERFVLLKTLDTRKTGEEAEPMLSL